MTVVLAWLFAGVIVALVALLVVVGRDRARLKETERRSRLGAEHARLHLSVLARAGDEMSGALASYDEAMYRLVDVVVPAFADWLAVDVVDEAGEVQRVVAGDHHGAVTSLPAHRHPEGDQLVRRVIVSGRDVVLANMPGVRLAESSKPHEGALVVPESLAPSPVPGVESMAIVPVHVRGLALGALSFVTAPGRRGFRLSDLETAHGLAERVAVAIERVLLWRESRGAEEEAVARASQLRVLMEAALAVNAPLSEPEILAVLAEHARRVMGSERAWVCTLPRSGQRPADERRPTEASLAGREHADAYEGEAAVMAVVSSPAVAPEELGELVPAVCDLVVEFDQPLRSAGARRPTAIGSQQQEGDAPEVDDLPDGLQFELSRVPKAEKPWIAVPVPGAYGQGRRVIVLEGMSGAERSSPWAQADAFGAQDESVLELLAQIASVALVNAHLYQEVRGSERRLRAVVESSPLAIAELSPGGDARWWNRATEELFGFPDPQAPWRIPVHPESDAAWFEMIERSSHAVASVGTDMRGLAPDDELKELSVSSAPLFDHEGEVSGILVVAEDVTERRRVLEQMHRSQRLASMARLAGGVAHDFNNLLSVILGSSDLLARRADADERWQEEVQAIQRAGQRAAALTTQLLAVGRSREVEPEVLDPDTELSSMLPMLERVLGAGVHLELAPPKGKARIYVDPMDLERSVLNLAINARDAMSQGGSFVLSTRVVDPEHRSGDGGPTHGRFVAVSAADTGPGMDEQTAKRCFEPFFTTKPEGEGTGLGLFAVNAIVTQAGGRVTVDAELGRGTTITMWFPALEDA
ncbi:MAG TPA: ATP-binding protein [Acidimicrobiales bacterium]|nr:ATP-binding protein [Acidimicrobiales bacterium]